jgi:hypothetical protein
MNTDKSYVLRNSAKSEISAALATHLRDGGPGERLVRLGFSQANFSAFLADLAVRACAKGYDSSKLTALFTQCAAGNASQARQACKDISVKFEGADKEQSLESLWAKATPTSINTDDLLAL